MTELSRLTDRGCWPERRYVASCLMVARHRWLGGCCPTHPLQARGQATGTHSVSCPSVKQPPQGREHGAVMVFNVLLFGEECAGRILGFQPAPKTGSCLFRPAFSRMASSWVQWREQPCSILRHLWGRGEEGGGWGVVVAGRRRGRPGCRRVASLATSPAPRGRYRTAASHRCLPVPIVDALMTMALPRSQPGSRLFPTVLAVCSGITPQHNLTGCLAALCAWH